ncbi:MAG: Hpt domain-containing protein [Myxococcales bacterium]|nr:Hpt domain-containing protein [Myxococcales bacterium]
MSVEARLAKLREAYGVALPAKLAELRAALAAADSGEGIAAARALAHRLRGTAATYGFAAVSEAAGRIEDALDADPPPSREARTTLAATLPAP